MNEQIRPPQYTGPDPVFRPNDPSTAQANYPQPPHSSHNQPPHPVPYGQPPPPGSNQLVMHVNPMMQNRPPPNFQLSNCQGRKRALLVGINYFKSPNELKGCINDVHNVKQFLMTLYNFREEDMVILTDDQTNPRFIPTKQNMISGMQWLVHDARPNDSFFFHFSGHGGRVKDLDGDEDDGWDETIYPVDHKMYPGDTGQLVDDDMHQIMVRPLPPGCRLTAIFDSCHSGTALDLPYVYSTQGNIKEQSLFKDTGSGLLSAGMKYASGNVGGALSSVMSIGNKLLKGKSVDERVKQFKSSPADVVMFSGCKDEQTSADSFEAGRSTGAMSFAFTTALRQNRSQSYLQLLNSVRQILREKYSQRPQLSSSHPIDLIGQTKSRKEAVSHLNVMVVGMTGSGKSAFVKTLYERMKYNIIQGTYRESKLAVMKEPLQKTEDLYSISMQLEENGQRTALTVIDTPGLTSGANADQQLRYITNYIDHQFERTLAEETKVRRDAKALDTHIHTCIYFINTSEGSFSDIDRYIIRLLSSRVNVVPVIGKADTLTLAQREILKKSLRRETFDIMHIPVYGYIATGDEYDDDEDTDDNDDDEEEESNEDSEEDSQGDERRENYSQLTKKKGEIELEGSVTIKRIVDMLQERVDEDRDEDAAAMIDYLEHMPFTLISYEEDHDTGRPVFLTQSSSSDSGYDEPCSPTPVNGNATSPTYRNQHKKSDKTSRPILGRRYPWATIECCNPEHCEFEILKSILLSAHRDMLRIDTYERFYEQYRTEQLLTRRVNKMMALQAQGKIRV
ncbi:Ca(2+)-dependent cysteine protease [Apophysomyces sp. BC1015]|nr:Ca(2+)-dependent cysteine protease [Apophysomyces sp. BC1015]